MTKFPPLPSNSFTEYFIPPLHFRYSIQQFFISIVTFPQATTYESHYNFKCANYNEV
jgi:hypothetical protein